MKLVFLHIEKSAGTSFRGMLKSSIGDKKVPWFAIDFHSNNFNEVEIDEAIIIGGHRDYAYYNNEDFGYLSIVREPTERVLSLYNYFKTRESVFWNAQKGFDDKSLNNTLKNCQLFCNAIRNRQCTYLSGKNSFEFAKEHINNNKFLIGDFERIADFTEALSEGLGLNLTALPRENLGKAGYTDEIIYNEETQQLLEPLISEDNKLYDYIHSVGLINTIADCDWSSVSDLIRKSRLTS